MKGDHFYKEKPLSYFHRDLEIARKLSRCIMAMEPETVVMEAREIADFIHKRILRIKPELKSFLIAMEDIVDSRLESREDRFRTSELVQISLIAKTFQDLTLRRYLCAYKMMLTVSRAERLFVDAILIYYSAIVESRIRKGTRPEQDYEIMDEVERGINTIIRNLHNRNHMYERKHSPLPPFVYSEKREREIDYMLKLQNRLEEILEERSTPLRRKILRKRCLANEFFVPPHEVPVTYGYKFRKGLYSSHAQVLKEPNRIIQNQRELSQKGYALYISFETMEAFRDNETIYDAMNQSMDLMESHLEGKTTKREVFQSLVRLATIADQLRDDALCYQVETFVNAMDSILGKQVPSRALRTDLSASLEVNYHIQSPRKTVEILEYHMDSMRYMDDVMKNYDTLLPVLEDLRNGKDMVAESEPPYRPDITETDMEHLLSGSVNVSKVYDRYVRNTRSPLPLDDKLRKDSIDELLSRTDDIRYEIYSIVPDDDDVTIFRSMNFNIRDIF